MRHMYSHIPKFIPQFYGNMTHKSEPLFVQNWIQPLMYTICEQNMAQRTAVPPLCVEIGFTRTFPEYQDATLK